MAVSKPAVHTINGRADCNTITSSLFLQALPLTMPSDHALCPSIEFDLIACSLDMIASALDGALR